MRELLEQLGLTSAQARVLSALLLIGEAPATQLPRMAEIHRTNVYGILEVLRDKGLVTPVPRSGIARWRACPPEVIVRQLRSAELAIIEEATSALRAESEQRAAEIEGRRQRLITLTEELDQLLASDAIVEPDRPPVAMGSLHILTGLAQYSHEDVHLYREARGEVMVLNRGPYGELKVIPEVLEALRRGVRIRALYMQSEVEEAPAGFREGVSTYHEAGVEGRVVDQIPIAMSVFDRRWVLCWLEDPVSAAPGVGTPMAVDHPDYGAAMADLFERRWREARPYPEGSANTIASGGQQNEVDLAGVAARSKHQSAELSSE